MGSTTTNYGLYKPAVGEVGWGADVNTSTDTVDAQMKTNADAIALNTTHRGSDGSDHTFLNQSVISGASPTFSGTNISAIPAASILAGTFGSGAFVFDNTVSGITTLTATTLAGTLSTAAQPNVTSLGTLTSLVVDDMTLNGNTISSAGASSMTLTAFAGQAVDVEGCTFDGGAAAVTTLDIGSTVAITGVLDQDDMSSDSDVSLATQQSIKKYVDDQVATSDTLQEVFDNGQTITVANTDNQSLTLTQNDTTNNPDMLVIANTGTGNDIAAPNASLKNGAFTGTSFTDGTITITGGNLTGATGVTATTLTGTLATAAQGNVTSVGTLTGLTLGGTLDMQANSITMTGSLGTTGSRLTKAWLTDLEVTNAIAGSVTGNAGTVTTITGLAPDTATTAAAQPNITSVGTLTTLTVDDMTLNGNAISSVGASALTVTPTAGQKLILDGHLGIDANAITAETDNNTTITAYAGKNITVESVTFDGGVVGGVSSLTASGTVQAGDLSDGTTTLNVTELGVSAINFVIDGGGAAITTGIKGDVEIPFACTINQVTLLADQSTTTTIDIWKDTYANFPPTDADSITAAAVPGTSAATKDQDSTLTGWTTSVAAGDILRYNVDANDNAERVTISLKVTKV